MIMTVNPQTDDKVQLTQLSSVIFAVYGTTVFVAETRNDAYVKVGGL